MVIRIQRNADIYKISADIYGDLMKLVMYQPFQLQLTNAAFFLTTAMIVDGTVLTRTPV